MNVDLRRILQEEKEEKQRLQLQLQATKEALEKLKCNKGLRKPSSHVSRSTTEIKIDLSISCTFYDDYFTTFEKHIVGIRPNLLKKMGYQGKGLDINGQGIMNPIKLEGLPHYAGLGYVRKEVGECSKTTNDQQKIDDE